MLKVRVGTCGLLLNLHGRVLLLSWLILHAGHLGCKKGLGLLNI
jgi:hypothetical protein